MRVAVSNIAWTPHDDPSVLARLRAAGVSGIEVAPTKVWPSWEGATPEAGRAYADRLAGEGFLVPAFQAITFGLEGASVFGDAAARARLVEHLAGVAALAGAMGARTLVFGSPKLRDPGDMAADRAFALAVDLFGSAGARCWSEGVSLALEANPPEYGCRFATTLVEVADLVAAVDHPGFRLHLDAGQLAMSEPDVDAALARAVPMAVHAHASQPQLGRFAPPHPIHGRVASALAAHGYDGWVSVEMREDPDDPIAALDGALAALNDIYRPENSHD